MALIASAHADITRILQRLGFQVLETADPADAADRADLVLVPFVNRPLDALSWCAALSERAPGLPVIVITRSSREIAEALSAGACDVLRHPLREDELAARVGGWLEARRARRPSQVSLIEPGMAARLLDLLPEPTLTIDEAGRVLQFNRAAEHLSGYPASEVVGKMELGDLLAGTSEASRLWLELRRSRTGSIDGRRAQLRAMGGERIPLQVLAVTVDDPDGARTGALCVLRDDRENQSLSSRLADATQQIVEAERRAAAARSAASAAHELNQPLTSVMGIVEILLMRPELSEDSRAKLNRAYGQLERMAELVRSLGQVGVGSRTPSGVFEAES